MGGLLSTDGRSAPECTRRLGEARQTFQTLKSIWNHANINKYRKKEIFEACVISKLMYGLESLWLLKADRGKQDAFYVRCLRRISKVAPSFISRIPTQAVLSQLGAKPLSQQLIARQLVLLGKICHRDSDNLSRTVLLDGDGAVTPRTWKTARRVGRPCLRWSSCVQSIAIHICDHSKTKL